VFQHIPPSILADLLARLDIGGFCSLHMTLFRGHPAVPFGARSGSHWSYDGETMRLLVEQVLASLAQPIYDVAVQKLS
jgi:hypothetical protein